MHNPNQIHTLWIGDKLTAMELLTLHSFIHYGFEVNLWMYSKITNVPDNVYIKDANEIIEQNSIFYYKHRNKYGHGKGSVSGFSDIFRYKLLYEQGGIWVDMDITCLKQFSINTPYFFRYHHHIGLVGNILKAPINAPLMQWCYEKSIADVNDENTNWLLPIEILKKGVYHFNLEEYIQNISNPDSFPIVKKLFIHSSTNINHWGAIHWMNEEFRRLQIDKNFVISGSTYQSLLDIYHIPYKIATQKEARKIKWKVSKIQYAFINLEARYKWYKDKMLSFFKQQTIR